MEQEPNQTQIHSILAFECPGAVKVLGDGPQPKVNVIVEVRRDESRRVSCPFLKGVRTAEEEDTQFYCTATPLKTDALTFEDVVNIANKDRSLSPFKHFNNKFPVCILKRPL